MIDIRFKPNNLIQRFVLERNNDYLIQSKTLEEHTILLILRDLLRLGWEVSFRIDQISITPPLIYDKVIIKKSMDIKRQETISKNKVWIENHIDIAKNNLADGEEVWQSKIKPIIEVCNKQAQFDIFRIYRYYWSSPYSEYVGRRIKLLIRDGALPTKPIIGIAALGSSIVHIPDRDDWVGWNKDVRTKNLIYTMDAYVLGALPPYSYLLGGKLISYIMASNEVRNIFHKKYKQAITNISKRKANDIACIFTTSLYGKSSQYNRLKYDNSLLFQLIGETKGFGTLHLTDETFMAMRELLKSKGIFITSNFGDGPIWSMRVIRAAGAILGFNPDLLLKHSFKRAIYAIPLAQNCREFLQGTSNTLEYYDYPLTSLVNFWHQRWFVKRKTNKKVKKDVLSFKKEHFKI